MKRLNILLLLLCLIVACKKKKEKKGIYDNYKGQITALRNGKSWNLKVGAYYDSNNRFVMRWADVREDESVWDVMYVANVPLNIGKYPFYAKRVWDTSIDMLIKNSPYVSYNGSFNEGGDVSALSVISNEIEPYITVDEFNSNTNHVKGTYQVAFRRTGANPLNLLDSVIYREAQYEATIQSEQDFYNQQ
jgi:hypothetical protein